MARSAVGNNKSITSLFIKMLLLALGSFLLSGIITWVVSIAFDNSSAIINLVGSENEFQILFLIYIIFFVISIAVAFYAFIGKDELSGAAYVKKFEATEKNLWVGALKPRELTPEQQASLRRQEAKRAADAESSLEEGDDSLDDVLAASDEDGKDGAASPEAAPSGNLSVKAEKEKVNMMNFLSLSLENIHDSRPKLDTFNKFGVNLYVAGACDALGMSQNLSDEEVTQIMVESVGVLGTKPDQALKFADSFQDYLFNPKYLGMIESGREAMQAQVGDDPNAAQRLNKALDGWNSKSGAAGGGIEESSSGTIAVMFTDIVGSTAMTQNHGDEAAQEVVRTHNRIVRAALTTYHGREVKHTGDGIMASFPNTANSVGAAIYIQRKTYESNKNDPKVPLGVKIGINAGEPIVEDDDLFGTTVQLSARIVDKAGNYEIFVSEIVKGICAGKNYRFKNRGGREMKGFDEPITMYEVEWQN